MHAQVARVVEVGPQPALHRGGELAGDREAKADPARSGGARGVGAIKDVPVVEDGRIVPGKVMRMTLSVDHRVFYGATAARFMAEVKRLIENPVTLLVSGS